MNRFKRILNMAIVVLASMAFVAIAPSASANNNHHHHHHHNHHNHHHHHHNHHHNHHGDHHGKDVKINGISTSKTTATINFRAKKFKNQDVTAIVSVKEKSSGNLVEKAGQAKLDGDGNGNVKIGGLKSGTSYEFKVRVGDSKNSSDKPGTTS